MDKLNIAFYSDTYLPAIDGVVTSMLNFKGELEKRGHKVYIFASGDRQSKKKYNNKRVYISTGVKFTPYPQYKIAIFPYSAVLKLNSLGIDVMHAQTPFSMGIAGMTFAKLGRYPIVGSFHTMINNSEIVKSYYPKNKTLRKFTSRYMMRYVSFFYNRCDATIAPSPSVERMLDKIGVSNVHVVPNSVNTKEFNPRVSGNGLRRKLGIKEDEKMVLYLGRMSREKKVGVLLKAAKELTKKDKKIKFVMGGSGPAIEYYKRMAHSLNLSESVKFIGFVDREVLPKLYASCDAFCIPSTFETQGIVALEAMASGKPVVGANILALGEVIKDGKNGEKFRGGDYRGCARKIEKVLNNTDSYTKGAVETAKEFAIDKATDKLLDVYKLILHNT